MVQGQDLELKSIEWSIHGQEENVQETGIRIRGQRTGVKGKTSGVRKKELKDKEQVPRHRRRILGKEEGIQRIGSGVRGMGRGQ